MTNDHKLGGLKQHNFFTVSEDRSLKSRCLQGWFLLKSLRVNPPHASLLAAAGCGQSLVFLASQLLLCLSSSHAFLPCVCLWLLLLSWGHPSMDLGPTVIPHDFILTWYICKDPNSKDGQVHRNLELELQGIFLGDTTLYPIHWWSFPEAVLTVERALSGCCLCPFDMAPVSFLLPSFLSILKTESWLQTDNLAPV